MNKKTLDNATTILGLIAGSSQVLGSAGIINRQTADTVSGFATVFLGYLTQRPAN